MKILGIGNSFNQSGHSWKLTGFEKIDGVWYGVAVSNQTVGGKSHQRTQRFTLKQIEDSV